MNIPWSAIGDLARVGTVLLGVLGTAVTVGALITRRHVLALYVAVGVGALGALYAVTLLGVALLTPARTLAAGEEKSCEGVDPHLHFRVAGTRRDGDTLLVTVHLRSDALRAIQNPTTFRAVLFDARGRRYSPLSSSAAAAGTFPVFARRLAPGESYDATLRFVPDPDAAGLRLLVDDLGWPGPLEIGSEASPFHRKTWFALAGV